MRASSSSLTFKNQPRGKLIIQKRDSQTNEVLPGAEFRVTTAAGCEVGLDGVIGTSSLTQNGIFTTDAQGEIRISNLAPGAYVINEIKAPDGGYVIDTPSTNVVIGQGGDTQTVVIKNTKKGGLIVEKYDKVTKEPLAGARFKIMMANGELTPDNEGLTSSNGLYTTDQNGQIVLSKLLPGTYVVSEDMAPENYRKDPTPQTVVVNAGDTQTVRFYDDPLCTLQILKRDSVTKKPLKGAEFLVRDSEGKAIGPNNGLYTTGTDGTVTVTGLEPNSTIVVSEKRAPTGYILDETPKNIVVRSGVANSLIFDNEPGTTLIIRKFIEGTENEPLSGVCFRVVDGSGAAVGPDDGRYYTDKAGEIVLEGIEPGTTVKVREIKTVEGFVLDGTPQDILIKGGEVQQLTFWNKRAGTLVIQKKDSVSGALISGAQFQLTYAAGGYVDNDNGHLSSNGLYTTDDKGQIRIDGIIGTVVAKEVKAAPGYVIDQSTQVQTVTVNPMDTQTLTFMNEPLCSLTVTKLDSVTGKPVPNTQFAIKDGNGNVLATCTTGKDGTATVTGLVPNSTVVVVETRVPSGYVLNTTPQTIIVRNGSNTVTNSGTSSSGNVPTNPSGNTTTNPGTGTGNDLTFENDPKQTLTIHKYIEGTKNEPLAGVTFKLVDGSGTPVGPSDGTFVTDSKGEIVVEGLEPGTTITAQEVKTVEGFVLDGMPKSVKIKAGQGAPSLTFWNAKAGELVIRKLDSVTKRPLSGVEFELTYAGGGYVDNADGHLSSNGLYTTDSHGEIHISGVTGTIVVKETKTIPGYTIDESTRTQTVKVNPQDTQTYYSQIRATSDRLCREHGLSVIMEGQPSKAVSYIEWLRQSKGQPTFRSMLEADLRTAIEGANDLGHFYLLMEHMGYEIYHGNRLGFRLRGQERFMYPVRKNGLFTEEGIRAAIEGNLTAIEAGQRPTTVRRPVYRPFKKHPKYTGIMALYVHYLYVLGKVEQRRYPPRMTPQLRQEVMKAERYRAQFTFLRENDISTQQDMAAFEAHTEETLASLTKQRTILNVRKKKRRKLYDALADVEALAPACQLYEEGLSGMESEFARCMDAMAVLEKCGIPRERLTSEKADIYRHLADVNRQIRAERKKLVLCRDIQENLPQMEQEIQKIKTKENEVKHDERRRR